MSLEAAERDTTMSWSDEDQAVHVTSARRADITKILAIPGVEILSDVNHQGTRILMAVLPAGSITFRKVAKGRRSQSAESKPRSTRTAMPSSAPRCQGHKIDKETGEKGDKCNMLAKGDTGFCRWHQDQAN